MFIYTAKSYGRGSFHGSLRFAISRSCLWIAHHRDQSDRDKSDHGGEHVEGRRISQSADQKSRDHRAGRLADVPDGSEHAHGGAEARSAMSALVTGVTAPTPTPSSGAAKRKKARLSLRKINGSAAAQSRRPTMMTGIRPTRSETRPVIGFATMARTNCAPRTIAISASLSPTFLA